MNKKINGNTLSPKIFLEHFLQRLCCWDAPGDKDLREIYEWINFKLYEEAIRLVYDVVDSSVSFSTT